ncbi:RloF [hydrothermal vent metagenome]|uniref:RloF n=1 Tax=hydrothermal vent metagenome TaxID=652676 RepID=A0A1W1E1B9_9ZZZZ
MSFLTMEPSNQTFKALLGNGVKYHVPRFQRDYSWEQEHWEDLWEDIENSNEEEHYMGYIVLQRNKEDKNAFSIIDGQQRLITLSLFVLASMSKIQNLINADKDSKDNKVRLDEIRRNFIGTLSPATLMPYNKLILNRNNNAKFKLLTDDLKPLKNSRLTRTDKLMSDCFKFFYEKITQNSGIDIVNSIEKITDSMLFTKIIVDDNLNAYKVFETLNARGVQLSTPDLLKNYLFSQVDNNRTVANEELDDMDEKWSEIISELGERNFTDFVRYYHNANYPLVTKKKLFASVRNKIQQPQEAKNYLKNLSKYTPIYTALNNPEDSLWSEQGYSSVKSYLKAFKLFNIKQPFLLLLTAYEKFNADEFVKLTKYLYILSIRYNVIAHYSPNKLDKVYNTLAVKISTQEFKRASHIKNQPEFKSLYPSDATFQAIFKYHTMPSRQSNKKIRFLLTEIENKLANTHSTYGNWTLEHIIPYHIPDKWVEYYEGQYSQEIDRLGNMTLLTTQENKDCGTQLFDKKQAIYQNSNSELSKKISAYEEWDSETLERHQDWLAQQAVNTWKINYE